MTDQNLQNTLHISLQQANQLALHGDIQAAVQLLEGVPTNPLTPPEIAILENNLGALAAMQSDTPAAERYFQSALDHNSDLAVASHNLKLLHSVHQSGRSQSDTPAPKQFNIPLEKTEQRTRIAIPSLLFNWPSTGGGTIHTAELAKFLTRFGYEVCHFYVQYSPWELGRVMPDPEVQRVAIPFEPESWNPEEIRQRIRDAIDRFQPDYVVITDSWNCKPLLSEAIAGYPYLVRFAALECLCPLNNVRLQINRQGTAIQCPQHQLATPEICQDCITQHGHQSGTLHQRERQLAELMHPDYYQRLRTCLADAEAVLVVNPFNQTMLEPYAKQVHVIPSGFDPARFPASIQVNPTPKPDGQPIRLFFAGLAQEYMKGFHILLQACERLWNKRQDFELLATADPPGQKNDFLRFIGWQSQDELPQAIAESDMLIFPTIAQEALGRSAVEAMAAARPVIASRIGGLQFTVLEGSTGLLFDPGNPVDLAAKIELLLDNPAMRTQLGKAGRAHFENHYSWDVIIPQKYVPIFGQPLKQQTPKSESSELCPSIE